MQGAEAAAAAGLRWDTGAAERDSAAAPRRRRWPCCAASARYARNAVYVISGRRKTELAEWFAGVVRPHPNHFGLSFGVQSLECPCIT